MTHPQSLTADLRHRLGDKKILLMTHLVLGYPSLAVNREVIARMAAAGVDCIELQIPFSEPMADGPVIVRANHERMRRVAQLGDGFVYVVARRGVTGAKTVLDDALASYLHRCRQATDLPLAVGFGIGERADVAMLEGRAEMATIGTATIRLVDQEGPAAVEPFLRGLRP